MAELSTAVRTLLEHAREDEVRRKKLQDTARTLRFAWAQGVNTLYKFRSLEGPNRGYTFDIIENSRIHFSGPEQFNDPFDCAPPFALAKSAADPDFVKELVADERKISADSGLTEEQIAELRRNEGVPIQDVPAAVRAATLKQLHDDTRIFCASAEQCHPLLWSHYADSHRGICLHFACGSGTLIGLARQVVCVERREPILIPLQYQTEDEITDKMVLVKAAFWQYESEYRIIGHKRAPWGHEFDDMGRVEFPSELLAGITLGMRISESDRADVLALVSKRAPTVPVWQAQDDPESFWMRIETHS